jgi:tetratricopeptide (TPR) repeat protein
VTTPKASNLLGRSLAINPNQPDAYNSRGNARKDLNQYDQALADYDLALALNPLFPDAWLNRGTVLRELARNAEAIVSFDKAIALNTRNFMAYNNRANTLKELRRYDEPLRDYDKALSFQPNNALILSNRGTVLAQMKRYDEALANCDKALELQPNDPIAHIMRGNVLAVMKRYDEALASNEHAIALDPRCANAYLSHAAILWSLGRHDTALANCDRAIAAKPDDYDAKFTKACLKIVLGHWQEGWELLYGEKSKRVAPRVARSLWLGTENLEAKVIVLHADQGLGDTIQCCRYVPMLEALGAKVIIEAPATLCLLLSTVSATASVIVRGHSLPPFDFHCPLSSLPLAFKTTTLTVPAKIPYLTTDPHKQKQSRDQLGVKTKPRVGLVWSSSGQMTTISKAGIYRTIEDCCRNIPLSLFQRVINPAFQYFSLQKETLHTDKATLDARNDIITCNNIIDNFADTAALVSEIDLIISVDTSVAHLAGALGKPVWILFPYSHYNLVALPGQEHSPWYPTARIFRQPKPDDWESVIDRVIDELKKLSLPA